MHHAGSYMQESRGKGSLRIPRGRFGIYTCGPERICPPLPMALPGEESGLHNSDRTSCGKVLRIPVPISVCSWERFSENPTSLHVGKVL